jgi:hypothetical protein
MGATLPEAPSHPRRTDSHSSPGREDGGVELKWLRLGSGFDDVLVDDWLEVSKVVGLLDGALLLQ